MSLDILMDAEIGRRAVSEKSEDGNMGKSLTIRTVKIVSTNNLKFSPEKISLCCSVNFLVCTSDPIQVTLS